MTDPGPLLVIGRQSPLLLLEANGTATAEAIWGWREAALTVRVVRGQKMRTVEGMFDEVPAALQFPHYFGENWAAFDECLAEMDWLPLDVGIVVVITNPADVLVDAVDTDLGKLVRTIDHACAAYSLPIASGEWWDRPAVPFHVVLQSSPTDTAAVIARWKAAGAVVLDFVT